MKIKKFMFLFCWFWKKLSIVIWEWKVERVDIVIMIYLSLEKVKLYIVCSSLKREKGWEKWVVIVRGRIGFGFVLK